MISETLWNALDAPVPEQNDRLREVVRSGALSASERDKALAIVAHNERDLGDPVMGPYHRGDLPGALRGLSASGEGEGSDRAYRLALAAAFTGDLDALRAVRGAGVRLSKLHGAYGPAAAYAIRTVECLMEFLEDGTPPDLKWEIGERGVDLLTRAAETSGNPDVVRLLIDRGAAPGPRALARALATGHEDAAYEMLLADPRLSPPTGARSLVAHARVLGRVCEHLREAASRSSERERAARLEKEAFVRDEFPALLTAAVASYSAEVRSLRAALRRRAAGPPGL